MRTAASSPVRVRFWGVRGSIPAPGPSTIKFGGNTSCIEIRTQRARVVLDAGSGIRALGQAMLKNEGPTGHDVTILITHTHWDHIQGLPFFAPAFLAGNRITVAGPEVFAPGFEKVIEDQTRHSYFPLRLGNMGATFAFRELNPGVYDDLVPGAVVRTAVTNHPVVDLAYRIEVEGRSVVYLMDHESWTNDYAASVRRGSSEALLEIERMVHGDLASDILDFIHGADLLIADAAYTAAEYPNRLGWGHSAHEHAYDLARAAGVKRLAFFHHDPNRTDEELEAIETRFRARNDAEGAVDEILAAREGLEVGV